jgi:flagellin
VESANGTLDATQRGFLNTEFTALRSEIDRIAGTTNFNGTNLLDGTIAAGLDLQVGINGTANDRVSVALASTTSTALAVNLNAVDTQANAQTALAALDAAITTVSTRRSSIGSVQSRLNVTMNNLATAREQLTAADSRIRDVDVAEETAAMTRNQILSQAGVAVLAQANQLPSAAMQLLRG